MLYASSLFASQFQLVFYMKLSVRVSAARSLSLSFQQQLLIHNRFTIIKDKCQLKENDKQLEDIIDLDESSLLLADIESIAKGEAK